MATELTAYNGRGFWAKEDPILLWLASLSRGVLRLKDPPDWLREAGDYWTDQAVNGYGCCPSAQLDLLLEGVSDISTLIAVSENVLRELESLEAGGEELASLGTFGLHSDRPEANGSIFLRYVVEVGRAFVDLLRGTIAPDDYPFPFVSVSGLFRSPQQPKPPEWRAIGSDEGSAAVNMGLSMSDLEAAKLIVTQLLGVEFSSEPWPSDPGHWYCAQRGAEQFQLIVNGLLDSQFPPEAVLLCIYTTVACARDYERIARSHFGSALGKVGKWY
jgi:hypothetical protein